MPLPPPLLRLLKRQPRRQLHKILITVSLILLGVITGAHGIKGEVKVKSFTEDPKAIASYGPLLLSDGKTVEIIRLKPAKDDFICTLKDVTSRNQAEALRGAELYTLRDKLPRDEILLADLIGRPVSNQSSVLGLILGFHNFGAGELVELDSGILIPVRFMGVNGDSITVDLPDGFLDVE